MDLVHGEILVHREPIKTRYRSIQGLKPGDTIAPLAFPDVSLAVADLLGFASFGPPQSLTGPAECPDSAKNEGRAPGLLDRAT